MTLNNVPTKLWLPRPPSIRLWVDCNRFSTHSADDWQVPSPLSGISKLTFTLAEPTHITAAAFVSRERLPFFSFFFFFPLYYCSHDLSGTMEALIWWYLDSCSHPLTFWILHSFSSRIIVFIPDPLIFISVYILVSFFNYYSVHVPFWQVIIILIMMRCHLVDKLVCVSCVIDISAS